MKYYSSVEDVITYTGAEYEKFNLNDDTELKALIKKWLIQVKSLIDNNRGRDLLRDLTFGDNIILVSSEEQWQEAELVNDNLPFDAETVNKASGKGKLAYFDTNIDLSNAKLLEVLLRPDVETNRGDISLKLYNGDTLIKELPVPKLFLNSWTMSKLYLGLDQQLTEIDKVEIHSKKQINLFIGNLSMKVIPEGIHNIAMRACANMVKLAFLNRQSPVISIEDMNARLVTDEILTSELKRELSMYPRKAIITISRIKNESEDY